MRKISLFLPALSVVALLGGCKTASDSNYGDYEVITASDIEDEADLTEIAYDFRIHPLKADGPLDGIGGVKSWGDVMLARTNDSRKILRFDNYRLTSVIDKLGRGPGEYYFIEDFSYDKANNAIYIENDSTLVTYDATTLEFKGKQPVNINIQNILNLGDQMLYYGFFLDEYNRTASEGKMNLPKESMILVDRDERDLKKGVVLYRESYLQRLTMGYPELFYVNPLNRSTCLTGFVNRIVTFDDKEVTDVYRFKLGNGVIPAGIDEIFDKEEMDAKELSAALTTISKAMSDGPSINLTFNIMVDNGTVSFRTTYNPHGEFDNSSQYLYWVHKDNETKVYRHLRIPGLSHDIDPTGANGNHQIAIIENLGDLAIDKDVPMSPLGQQIIDELKKQNDDNPVMLEFRFK